MNAISNYRPRLSFDSACLVRFVRLCFLLSAVHFGANRPAHQERESKMRKPLRSMILLPVRSPAAMDRKDYDAAAKRSYQEYLAKKPDDAGRPIFNWAMPTPPCINLR